MNSIKVCEYSRSRSFHDDLILQDQASGERSQDQWSSGTESSVSFFHDAFLCRILNFNNVFDAYNRCLSYCSSRSVDKCAFTKPFGYIFQERHPQDCVILLSLRPRQRKTKGI